MILQASRQRSARPLVRPATHSPARVARRYAVLRPRQGRMPSRGATGAFITNTDPSVKTSLLSVRSLVSSCTRHLRWVFWNPALISSALTTFEATSVTFLQIDVRISLNTGAPDQIGHRTIHSILESALRTTESEVPLAKLERARDSWSGELPKFFTSEIHDTPRATKKRMCGPSCAVSTSNASNAWECVLAAS